MGSPEFAVPTLRALIDDKGFDVVRVVSQPDRPKGRGRRLQPTPVRELGQSHGIATLQMSKDNYREVADELAAEPPVFLVVVAFGIILKEDLLDLPRIGCVNLHASLLPRYRGVSPIQAAILAGDDHTGCTTMVIDAGIDTGDILLTETTEIRGDDTAGSLEKRLADMGALLVVRTLAGLRDGSVQPQEQDDTQASYTKKIRKSHGRINWSEPAAVLERRVRAMQPWPTAYTSHAGKRLIILEANAHGAGGNASEPGRITSLDPFHVATGDGTLEILRVKLEGKRAMAPRALISGYPMQIDDRLGE